MNILNERLVIINEIYFRTTGGGMVLPQALGEFCNADGVPISRVPIYISFKSTKDINGVDKIREGTVVMIDDSKAISKLNKKNKELTSYRYRDNFIKVVKHTKAFRDFPMYPTHCPSCNNELMINPRAANRYCVADIFCNAILKGRIRNMIKYLAIDGLDEYVILKDSNITGFRDLSKLFNFAHLHTIEAIEDPYMYKDWLINILPRTPFKNILLALNVPTVGPLTVDEFVGVFNNLYSILNIDYSMLRNPKYVSLNRVRLAKVLTFLTDPNRANLFDRMRHFGVKNLEV